MTDAGARDPLPADSRADVAPDAVPHPALAAARPDPAPRAGLPWKRFLAVAAFVALDLWTKHAVFDWLSGQVEGVHYDAHGHRRLPVAGNWLALMLSTNPGAAFGQLGEHPRLLVGARLVAVVVLTWLLVRMERRQPVLVAALALVLAGALGNLFDNLWLGDTTPFAVLLGDGRLGEVRDFIDVYFASWDWHFPTFNVADSCITVGAALLLLSGLFSRSEPAAEAAPPGGARERVD